MLVAAVEKRLVTFPKELAGSHIRWATIDPGLSTGAARENTLGVTKPLMALHYFEPPMAGLPARSQPPVYTESALVRLY